MIKAPLPPEHLEAAWSQISDGNMSERFGPLDEAIANRTRFLKTLGLTLEDCVRLAVTKGTADRIREVDRTLAGIAMTGGEPKFYCDAYITSEPGLALWLLVADCLPIMFYDPEARRIALAHCGFASTDLRLAAKVVARLQELGSDPTALQVSIGPGIHASSYLFDKEHRKNTGPEWEPYLVHPNAGHTGYDLFAYNLAQLTGAGVPRANIQVSDVDTCTSDNFYSHVRSWRTGDTEGRFAAVIALKN